MASSSADPQAREWRNQLDRDFKEVYAINGLVVPPGVDRVCLVTSAGGGDVRYAHLIRHSEHQDVSLILSLIMLDLMPPQPEDRHARKCTVTNCIPLASNICRLLDCDPFKAVFLPTLEEAQCVIQKLETAWLRVEQSEGNDFILDIPLPASELTLYDYYHLDHRTGPGDPLPFIIRTDINGETFHCKVVHSSRRPVEWDPPLPNMWLRIPPLIAMLSAQNRFRSCVPADVRGEPMLETALAAEGDERFRKVLTLSAYAGVLCSASVSSWRDMRPSFLAPLPAAPAVIPDKTRIFPGFTALRELVLQLHGADHEAEPHESRSSTPRPRAALPPPEAPVMDPDETPSQTPRPSSPHGSAHRSDGTSTELGHGVENLSLESSGAPATSTASEAPIRSLNDETPPSSGT